MAKKDVLIRSQANFGLKALDQQTEATAQAEGTFIFDPAIFHAEAVKLLAVALGLPAQMQREIADLDRLGQFEGKREIASEHATEFLHAPIVDEVFDARPSAVAAVAMIAEKLDDGLGSLEGPGGRHITDRLGEKRKGVGVAVRHAHAAADQDVVAQNGLIFRDGQKPKILGIDIDGIVLGKCQPGLEFSRQIYLAV